MGRNERGAAAVEFALVAPLLIALLAGIAEFGRAYYLQTTISGSAREAVRSLALKNPPSTVILTAQNAASPLVLSDGQIKIVTPCPTPTPATPPDGKVVIKYPMTFMSGLFGPPLTLTGTGVMRCGG